MPHKPEWQIEPREFFERLHLKPEEFKDRLNLPNIRSINKILPLRNMTEIHSLVPISWELLTFLLRQIKTLDGQSAFSNINIASRKQDPRALKIGQKFVYRENYTMLLEKVPDVFQKFPITSCGLGDFSAFFVFGLDDCEAYAMACYLPPIIEKHETELVIMDGIHRNFIGKQTGKTLNALIVENVSVPFPCSMHDWPEIAVISLNDKPKDINDRYFDLQKGLFRDLKYLGIDG